MDKKKLASTIIAGMIGVGVTMAATSAVAADNNLEKCYGVVKAGQNDCGGPGTGHTCQGQATKSGDPNEWILLPKGTCDKIVGGSLTPAAVNNKK